MVGAENGHEAVRRHPVRRIGKRCRGVKGPPALGTIKPGLEYIAASSAERIGDAPVGPGARKCKADRRISCDPVVEPGRVAVVTHAVIVAAHAVWVAADICPAAVTGDP